MKKIFVKLLAVMLVAILALPLLCSCLEQGETGPAGEAGKDGAAGKSAYELAVEKGFNGTLEEWIASLAGANGAVGADGVAGEDGEDGEDGKNGRIGFVVTGEAELLTALTINNAYVVLANDITSDKTFAVPAGVNAVLNLNGKTLSSSVDPYTIDVKTNGTLTLIGNGTVTNVSEGSTTIRNYGTLIIGEEGVEAAPTITMGPKTHTANSAVKCEELSTLIIYNGTFEGAYRSIQTFGNTVICGGTFTKSVTAWEWVDGETVYESYLTILGGSFREEVVVGTNNTDTFPAGAQIAIYGGTYAVDPTTYVANGYTAEALPENAGYKVVAAAPAA